MADHLIIDAYQALELERDRHEQTLRLLEAIHRLIPTRDGASKVASGLCKLCVEWPPSRRLTCPGHTSRERVGKELARLAVPIRRPITKGRTAAKAEADEKTAHQLSVD